jgi:hypothetical protein
MTTTERRQRYLEDGELFAFTDMGEVGHALGGDVGRAALLAEYIERGIITEAEAEDG